jgi:hypothetical protein
MILRCVNMHVCDNNRTFSFCLSCNDCHKLSQFEAKVEQMQTNVILHFDIDCYYAQAEIVCDPSLKDKPVGTVEHQ